MVRPIEELGAWFCQSKSKAHGSANRRVRHMVRPIEELGTWFGQ
jgi:hypothetical protein